MAIPTQAEVEEVVADLERDPQRGFIVVDENYRRLAERDPGDGPKASAVLVILRGADDGE